MALEMWVLNPTADRYGTDLADLAPRPRSLSSSTVGLLWNGKPNGDVALRAIGSAMEARLPGTRTVFYSGSIPCDRELLARVAAECDVVVACTADCGSCSSWITHDASVLERAGIPAVVVASKGFEEDIAASARAFGVPNVQTVVVPEVYNNITAEASTRQSLDALDRIVATLEGTADAAVPPAGLDDPPELRFTGADPVGLLGAYNDHFLGRDWGDGYPLLPPTPEAVDALVRRIGADPDEVLFTVPPGNGQATPRKIAVACAMAGTTAAEMVVVEAALRAMQDPVQRDRFRTMLMSTSAHAPLVLVNGRHARALGINGGRGCIGPGARNRVNLRIGRAIVLALKNLGAWYPGVLDMDTIGSVRKNVVVVRENDEESPWAPFHTGAGFGPDDDAVSVFITLGESDVGFQGHLDGAQLARSISAFDTVHGGYFSDLFGGSQAKHSPNGRLLLVAPPHAEALQRDGIDRERLQELLFEYGHQPVARVIEIWRKLHADGKTLPEWDWLFELDTAAQRDRTIPVVRDAAQYSIAVCGSTRGKDLLMPTSSPPVTTGLRTDWIVEPD